MKLNEYRLRLHPTTPVEKKNSMRFLIFKHIFLIDEIDAPKLIKTKVSSCGDYDLFHNFKHHKSFY